MSVPEEVIGEDKDTVAAAAAAALAAALTVARSQQVETRSAP